MKNYFYKKKTNTTFLLLSTLLVLSSCFSVPVRVVPELNKEHETTTILGSLRIDGCNKLEIDQCVIYYSDLLRVMEKTHLFNKISFDQNVPTDYIMKIEPYYKNRYGIGHNPLFFALSTIIPFWEKIEYGYNFSLENLHEGKIYKINTKKNGINIMWSGSLLINIMNTRGLPITAYNNEVLYIRNIIINTLKK